MPVESATYISDLNASNPIGATDPLSSADDHLRLLKSTIKATFPSIAGAVTASHTELNYITGATGITGTGNTVRSASPTFTGTATFATVAATTITGAGSGITALNASNLASGTVPDARFPATLPALSGVNLTALNATQLTSGTVADARLSANVPLLSVMDSFALGIRATGGDFTGAAGAGAEVLTASSEAFFRGFNRSSVAYVPVHLVGSTVSLQIAGNDKLAVDAAGNFDFKGGTVTTAGASSAEVGTHGLPQNSQNVSYTTVLGDRNKNLHQTGASKTFTIDSNANVAYPIGTTLVFTCDNATGVSIAITADTLRLAGTASTGTRTLAQYGIATAVKVLSTTWLISGAGLT